MVDGGEWSEIARASRCSTDCGCGPYANGSRDAFRARAWGGLLEGSNLASLAMLTKACGLGGRQDIVRRYVCGLVHIGDIQGIEDFAAAAGDASAVSNFWQVEIPARHARNVPQQASQFFKCARLFDLCAIHNTKDQSDFDMAHLATARGREIAGFAASLERKPERLALVVQRVRKSMAAAQIANGQGAYRSTDWPDAAAIYWHAPRDIAVALDQKIKEGRSWHHALDDIEAEVERGPRPKHAAHRLLRNIVNDHVHLNGATSWSNADGLTGPTVDYINASVGIWGISTKKVGIAEATIRDAIQRHVQRTRLSQQNC